MSSTHVRPWTRTAMISFSIPHSAKGSVKSLAPTKPTGETTNCTIMTLPPEIVDKILGFVHVFPNDSSIYTCALVCKYWLPRSRHYAFGSITLFKVFPRWLKLVELLAHPLCTIRFHVRELSSIAVISFYLPALDDLPLLPNVTTLRLHQADICSSDDREWWQFAVPMARLTELDLQRCKFRCSCQLLDFLGACRMLRTLILDRTRSVRDSQWIGVMEEPHVCLPTEYRPPPSRYLQVFAAIDSCYSTILTIFPRIRHAPITTLSIHSIQVSSAPLAARLIQNVGPHLKFLVISFADDAPGASAAFCQSIDFSHAVNLESVHVGTVELGHLIDNSHFPPWHVPTLLEKLRSSNVRHIALQVAITKDEDLAKIAWEEVAMALEHPTYKDLETLIIEQPSSNEAVPEECVDKWLDSVRSGITLGSSFKMKSCIVNEEEKLL